MANAVERYGAELAARVVAVFGGQPIGRQLHTLGRGVDVVVATPGRALDHLTRGSLRLDGIRTVVLDEADEMLDMGFADDLEAILSATPDARQTVLFSATMPARITGIVRRHLREPVRIEIERPRPDGGAAPLVRQVAHLVDRRHKPAALARVLEMETPAAAIVFCRTRAEVDELTESLNRRGHRAEALHGGMGQDQRDRVMTRLRARAADLVVATDVAARGLDIDQLTHVVNYDVPAAPESYVHRIGRVGRAGREGVAVTLAEPRQQHLLRAIERATGQKIAVEKLPGAADLRRRRLDATTTALRDILLKDDLGGFGDVVATLADEFDLAEVARAAAKLAHERRYGAAAEEDIPDVAPRPERPRPADRPGRRATTGGTKPNGAGQRPAACSSVRDAPPGSAPRISWGPSPPPRRCAAPTSTSSRSPTASRSSPCPDPRSTRSSPGSARRACAAGGPPSGATGSADGGARRAHVAGRLLDVAPHTPVVARYRRRPAVEADWWCPEDRWWPPSARRVCP